MSPRPPSGARAGLTSPLVRSLRILGVAVLAFLAMRAVLGGPERPTRPEPHRFALDPADPEIERERMQALADKGVELLRAMRSGTVVRFDDDGIAVVTERFVGLGVARRDHLCRSLRVAEGEVRRVFDAASGRTLGHCREDARYVPVPAPAPTGAS